MNAQPAMRAESLQALLALFPRLAGLTRPRPATDRRTAACAGDATNAANEAIAAGATLPLARAAMRWVPRPRGWVVTCEAGALWLTFDNEECDIVLEAGQSHACESDSRLAIYALTAAQVQMHAADMPR